MSKSIQRGLPSAFLLAASLCTSFYAAAQDAPRGWARLDARAGAGVAVSGDATAAHYNPAALAQLEQDVAFDVGLSLEATQRTTGSSSTAGSVAAAWDVHPAPLLAAAWRPTPILAVGLAAGPGLVSGARFESPDELDVFSLTLYEVTPTLSVRLPPEWGFGSWALGLGYRLSFGQTTRERTQIPGAPDLDAAASMADAAGFRAGLFAEPMPELALGLRVDTPLSMGARAEPGRVGGGSADPLLVSLTVPLELAVGARFELDRYGLLVEYDYIDSSESGLAIFGETVFGEARFQQLVGGRDGHVLRLGAEVRLPLGRTELALRGGYLLATARGTARTPSPFGPLPARSHGVSLGAGLRMRGLELGVAGTYQGGGTEVTVEPDASCDSCGSAGRYKFRGWSVSLDVGFAPRI